MLIDLHVHSRHTPGCSLSPLDVVRRAREAGLDGVVFTDMNTLDGLAEIREAGKAAEFLALCGVEIATDRGHYLAFFPDPGKVAAPPQIFGTPPWPVQDVIAKVMSMGGAVVAAHPYDRSIERPGGDVLFTLDGISAVEGLDGRRKPVTNDLAVEAADHMGLPCVGGSGAKDSLARDREGGDALPRAGADRGRSRGPAQGRDGLQRGHRGHARTARGARSPWPREPSRRSGRGPRTGRDRGRGRGESRGPRRDR